MAEGALLSMSETHRLNRGKVQGRGEGRWLRARTAGMSGQLPKAGWQSGQTQGPLRLQKVLPALKTTCALHCAPGAEAQQEHSPATRGRARTGRESNPVVASTISGAGASRLLYEWLTPQSPHQQRGQAGMMSSAGSSAEAS